MTETAPVLIPGAGGLRRRFLVPLTPPRAPIRLDGPPITVGRAGGGAAVEQADARMSRAHFELRQARTANVLRVRDLESKNGISVSGQPTQEAYLQDGSVIRAGDSLFAVVDRDAPPVDPKGVEPGVAVARAWIEALADQVARTTLSVLITGPTGAGKELLALRLHDSSDRSGAFVPVNCAALPRELVASELFGHLSGAFSGARGERKGLFRAADGGTLFLDEVGELPGEQQAALLRALQEKRVRPVGSDREVAVDVRIVAATLRDLGQAEQAGDFREDLFARLAGFELHLPGLAVRRGDILPLFRVFLGAPLPIDADAAEALVVYDWPRNVRELKNVAERVRMFAGHAGRVGLSMLPTPIQRARRGTQPSAPRPQDARAELQALLTTHVGSVARVARALGQSRQKVYRRIEALGLDPKDFR